ncbi:MAG: hybrid sensor histidine kinase/response regulator [Micavibrio aeruginosavorus]|uniref:histidine kinase n=1 Tax=Micavibrio aeruginosavorus TaxID=349221 RepID=A0A2W4ZWU1_9BACT|nr:MAG: hybrid sensor histidine kinase/response regulator [Micavibrio aeruginosavorus]
MDDLIAEFLTETNESLAALDLDMVRLEQNPNDKELISGIFRLMHTIKGTCGFLGLPRLETVAHRAENVMGRFRDGDLLVTPAYVTLIFESFDRIKTIVSGLEETGSEPQGDDSALIEKLDAVFEGRDGNPDNGTSGVDVIPDSVANAVDPLQALFDATPVLSPDQFDSIVGVPDEPEPPKAIPAAPKVAETAKASGGEDGATKESALAAQSLRVNVDVLENLMTLVSELVLTRNQLLQILRGQKDTEFSGPLQRLSHVVSDLQEGVMKTRMQPIGNAWSKLPRIIRDLSLELGKKIDLEMIGADTELDRQILDMIKDPLTHMVRNSADHGIEIPADRAQAGKPETGRIVLNAYHEGGHIIIEITDDGKGLPLAKIKEKIIKNGLATGEELAGMTDQQIQQYIFRAGFSTAEKVTSVSGRGVGMDVVRTNIEKIGGSIVLKSTEGKGSTFLIKIPLTLAIVSALIVEAGGERFAIPQLSVRELVLSSAKSGSQIEMVKGTPFFRLRDHLLPLVSLKDLLNIKPATGEDNLTADLSSDRNKYIVVTQIGAYQFGIIVDRVFDTEEIVVKPVSRTLKEVEIFAGNTILGDGSVIMILDPNGIAKAMGESDVADAAARGKSEEKAEGGQNKTSLLLFRTQGNAPKAVPLSLVARLEEIDAKDIETSSGQSMVQYRGQLMPLVAFDSSVDLQSAGLKPVLVFSDETSTMGLVVGEIVDITEEVMQVQVSAATPGLVGSAIISGRATDVIDIGHYLHSTNKDWFKRHGSEAFGEAKLSGRKVLLVDDSPFFRNMLTPLLRMAGYEVTTLESPLDALALREDGQKFDLIVSDIEMPKMNGFEFAAKVREASSEWIDTPMIALTSHATEQDVNHGLDVGFSRYIAKFDRDTLLKTISETLISGHQGVRTDKISNGAAAR